MKYIVDVGGHSVVVEVYGDVARVEGSEVRVNLADLPGTPVSLVTLGDVVHRIAVARGAGRGRYVLSIDGRRFEVEALDERAHAIRQLSAATAPPAGSTPLLAPMPGLIVRVNVVPGDAVSAGQGLVVMEAMKMENELRAVGPGVVKTVRVSPGAAVERGALLVELE